MTKPTKIKRLNETCWAEVLVDDCSPSPADDPFFVARFISFDPDTPLTPHDYFDAGHITGMMRYQRSLKPAIMRDLYVSDPEQPGMPLVLRVAVRERDEFVDHGPETKIGCVFITELDLRRLWDDPTDYAMATAVALYEAEVWTAYINGWVYSLMLRTTERAGPISRLDFAMVHNIYDLSDANLDAVLAGMTPPELHGSIAHSRWTGAV